MKIRKSLVVCLISTLPLVVLALGWASSTSLSSPRWSTTTVLVSWKTTSLGPAGGKIALAVPASGSGGFNYTQGSYLEGFEFKAKKPITITKLGAYDSNLSKLPNGTERFSAVPVAVYDMSSNTLLGRVTVTASDPPTGVFRYGTLKNPIRLNKKDTYSVAWVSLSNYYICCPTLRASAVNPAISYVAMDGNGTGGLTQTRTMVEPNWFYTYADHGLKALNYDIGPNFMFSSR